MKIRGQEVVTPKSGSKIACKGGVVMVEYQEHHLVGGGKPANGVQDPADLCFRLTAK